MTNMIHEAAQIIRLEIPAMVERPAVGSLCCAIAAEDLITDELQSWPGVTVVKVDPSSGELDIQLDASAPPLAQLLDDLAGIGYPAIVPRHEHMDPGQVLSTQKGSSL